MAFGKWEDPAAVVRGILGGILAVATLVLIVLWLSPDGVDWHWSAFVGVLWAFWVLFHDVVNLIVRPLGEIFAGVTGGGPSPQPFTIDEETAHLERLLESPTADRHRKMVTAVRLAEIYRTHQGDLAKAERLLAQYPEAPRLDAPPHS